MKLSKLILPALFLFAALAVNAQNARLNFDKLNGLEQKAVEVIEVTIDGKMLDLAKRVLQKMKDQDAKKVAEAIKGLQGIYVRVYNFDKDGEYNPADIEEIRAQLTSVAGWERLANVRSKRNNQKVDVFTMFAGDQMSGVAVVLSETRSVAFVNVIGTIDIDLLMELSGNLNIPKIDLEKESENKPKNQ